MAISQLRVVSGSVNTNGTLVTILYQIIVGVVGAVSIQAGKSAFVTVGGIDHPIVSISSQTDPTGEGAYREVVFNVGSTIPTGAATFSEDAHFVEDATGNYAQAVSAQSITNNVPGGFSQLGIRGRTRWQGRVRS